MTFAEKVSLIAQNIPKVYEAGKKSVANNGVTELVNKSIVEFEDDTITELGDYVFYKCENLTRVNAPKVTTIGTSTMHYCINLNSINFPKVETVGGGAFRNCESLTSVELPKATTIKTSAFQNCKNLKYADLPSATTLESAVFRTCPALETLILRYSGVVTLANVTALAETKIANSTGYVYVPRTQVDFYKSNTIWMTYADKIRAIEDYPEITGG